MRAHDAGQPLVTEGRRRAHDELAVDDLITHVKPVEQIEDLTGDPRTEPRGGHGASSR